MRMPFANTALASVLTLLAASTPGAAQTGRASVGAPDLGSPQWADAGPGAYGGYGDAGPIGVPGAMFQPQYGTMPPQALYPPQGPNTMNPWPEVSPFHPPNVSYTQHVNKNGLWMRDTVHRKTDYELGIEYIQSSFEKPRDTLVGSNFQPLINLGGVLGLQGQFVRTSGLGPEQPLDLISNTFPGAFPFPFIRDTATTIVATADGTFFPIHTLGALDGGNNADGIKLRWGMMHEDGTGWGASGYWSNEANMVYARGHDNIFGQPIDQTLIGLNPDIIFTLIGGLPLIFGDTLLGDAGQTVGYLGDTQKFDILYRLDHDTFSAGVHANRYTGLIHKSDSVRVTSFVGARYLHLDENFRFHGIDSGFGYDFEDDGDDNVDFGRPTSALIFDSPLLHARLNSTVQSHMAGPQVGFRIDIGSHGAFHVWTETTGSLLANYERLEVNGDNIGVAILRPDMHDGVQFLDNSFRDQEHHVHVSPLFEQSIYADVRLKNVLPFLKKSYLLEEAQFRVGYTVTWVGYISRPGASINWVGFPKFPSVKVNRENFTMSQFSLGLTFPY
jgi:hypothetical protein